MSLATAVQHRVDPLTGPTNGVADDGLRDSSVHGSLNGDPHGATLIQHRFVGLGPVGVGDLDEFQGQLLLSGHLLLPSSRHGHTVHDGGGAVNPHMTGTASG